MKLLPLLVVAALLSGCAGQDIVSIEGATTVQRNDLRDLDYDGVIEAREKCDDTLRGAKVDNDGCPRDYTKSQAFRLNITFANNSSELRPRNYGKIEQLAEFINTYSDTTVVIEGHASKTGDSQKNLELSQQRAKAIADSLIRDFGIAASRVESVGYGDTRPLIDEGTQAAHEANRRVMANLTGSFNDTDMRWTIYSAE